MVSGAIQVATKKQDARLGNTKKSTCTLLLTSVTLDANDGS